jgi:hypothetical protein
VHEGAEIKALLFIVLLQYFLSDRDKIRNFLDTKILQFRQGFFWDKRFSFFRHQIFIVLDKCLVIFRLSILDNNIKDFRFIMEII